MHVFLLNHDLLNSCIELLDEKFDAILDNNLRSTGSGRHKDVFDSIKPAQFQFFRPINQAGATTLVAGKFHQSTAV